MRVVRAFASATAVVVLASCGGSRPDTIVSSRTWLPSSSAVASSAVASSAAPSSSIATTVPTTRPTTTRGPIGPAGPTTTVPRIAAYDGGASLTPTECEFTLDQGDITDEPDGSSHSRRGTQYVTVHSDDPRVNTTGVETWNSDRWGILENGALIEWGTSALSNLAGTWEGRFVGVYTSETSEVVMWWYRGTRAYEGLSLVLWITESLSGTCWALVLPAAVPPPFADAASSGPTTLSPAEP